MKKILIACPTAKVKNYAFEQWLLSINQFTYPNFDVVMFDNTQDYGKNTKWLNDKFKQLSATTNFKFDFKAMHSAGLEKEKHIVVRLCKSHNDCAQYSKTNGYDAMLHLESDVFAPKDTIEKLLMHNKNVTGGLYYRDEGIARKLMVQQLIKQSPKKAHAYNFTNKDDVTFIDGTLKKVYSIGLGCILIDSQVINNGLQFRVLKNKDTSADSFFAEDMHRAKINIWADTSLLCEHRNEAWGIHGIDFK